MEAVMRQRHAVGLPWRRGDQWGATHATFAGQEQAAAAFERTARSRLVNTSQDKQRAGLRLCERVRGAPKNKNSFARLHKKL